MLDLIRRSNGDILGILLFIIIIVYFQNIDKKNTHEYIIYYGSIIALCVDTYIVYNLI